VRKLIAMASHYQDDDTLTQRPRPVRTAMIVAGLAFLIGAIMMGLALTRWAPAQQWLASQSQAANSTAPVSQVVAALPPATPSAVVTQAQPPAAPPALIASPTSPEVDSRVSELEARIARVDLRAAAAAGNAGRAEGMLIAFAARRAIDRGTGLGYVEGQLRERFGTTQPRAVAQVIAAAQAPVTLSGLRQQLDALAPQLAANVKTEDWWSATQRTLSSLIVVRREGRGSPAPDERLARARLMIDGGQVDGALAEVSRLPGAEAAGSWSAAARRWIEAHQALDILEAAAIMPPPPGSVPPAPAAAN
jgi:hypothetical protein